MNDNLDAVLPTTDDSSLISVIIPNYNYAHFLDTCLESLKAQTIEPQRVEVVLVDDKSTDNSMDVAQCWEKKHPWRNFRIFCTSHVGRPGPVRNIGLRSAQGNLLICLDPDDILEPDALRAMAEALENAPNASLVYTDYIEKKGSDERVIHIPEPGAATVDLLQNQNPFASTIMFRRAVWRRIGGYSGATLYEDWDYWVRAAAAGFSWTHVPKPLIRHRIHAGSFSEKAIRDDARAKAAIVLRSPAFFAPEVYFWAKKIMKNAPWMPLFPRGIIPSAENMHTLREHCEKKLGVAVRLFFEE